VLISEVDIITISFLLIRSQGDKLEKVVRHEAVVVTEIVRQNNIRVCPALGIAICSRNVLQRHIGRRRVGGVVLIHQTPDLGGIHAPAEGVDIQAREPEIADAVPYGIVGAGEIPTATGILAVVCVSSCLFA
jgi:hypothetical protein